MSDHTGENSAFLWFFDIIYGWFLMVNSENLFLCPGQKWRMTRSFLMCPIQLIKPVKAFGLRKKLMNDAEIPPPMDRSVEFIQRIKLSGFLTILHLFLEN